MRVPRIPGTIGILVAAILLAAPAAARDNGAPPRALAMGDAVHAMGMGTSGLYFNPATMSQTMAYAIDVGYGYRSWTNGHNVHLAFVDSKTNPDVAGGSGYTYTYAKKNDIKTQIHDIRFAASSQYRTGSFLLCYGAGLRTFQLKQDGPTGIPSLGDWMWDMDIGVLLGVSDLFYIGVSAMNVIGKSRTDRSLRISKQSTATNLFAPRTFATSIGFSYSILNVGLGMDIDLQSKGENKATINGPLVGVELTLAQMIALRAGFAWDRVGTGVLRDGHEQMRVSAGLGYVSKYVGVDVGYAHDVTHSSDWLIESSIRVFLP